LRLLNDRRDGRDESHLLDDTSGLRLLLMLVDTLDGLAGPVIGV